MKYSFIPLLLFPSLLIAQKALQGVVVNSKREPLPLTNIVQLNGNSGTITNENGQFSFGGLTPTDSIKITNITYYSKTIAVSSFNNNDTIVLNENIRQLNSIVLKNLSAYKSETTLGFYDYSNKGSFMLGPGNQLATYIVNKKGMEGWIKGVTFKLKATGKCKNSIRVRILQTDSERSMPGNDILGENIIIKPADLKKANYIDLSSFKIMLPEEGAFIVVEWLSPDEQCDKNLYTVLSATLSEPANIVWFNYRDRAWSKDRRPRLPNGNYMTPNVGLKVAY